MRFCLIPILIAICGSAAYAQRSVSTPSRNDTAIVNDWYKRAFDSKEDNLKKSDDLTNKAWKMAIDIAYDKGIADGYYYTGCIYEQKGLLNVATRYFERAISLYTAGNFFDNLADCHRRLGDFYMQEEKYYTAFQHFLSGLQVAEEHDFLRDQIELGIQLANYHNTVSKDYKEAIDMLNVAEQQAKSGRYSPMLGPVYMQYAIAYTGQRKFNQALHYSQLAKRYLTTPANQENLLRTLLIEGLIFSRLPDESRLAAIVDESHVLLDGNQDKGLEAWYKLLQAAQLYLSKDYSAASDSCEALYLQTSGRNRRDMWRQIRLLHIRVRYSMGDFRQADSLLNDYERNQDSLYTAQYVGQGMEISENYKLEKFERQIKEQELELANTNYQRYGLIAGVMVLLTILGILYFHFREKDRLAHRVALKNAEISVQNEILKQANRQNELLLREIHHRVKNNLQIINSLLNLQSRKTNNKDVIAMMQESSSRIHSIALIHNKLYQQQSINRLNVQEYIEQLAAHLLSIYNVGQKNVQFKVEANDVSLDIDTAIPIGLILTELMTNSLKYAFVGREEGEIHVCVTQEGECEYELVFKDNGVGIPEAILKQPHETLGFRLIHSLTKQLAGIIQYTFGECSMYHIRFKG